MSERNKGQIYNCPVCERHGFAWDKAIWLCHYPSCGHTEKHRDPKDEQVQTLFKALRYLVANTPDRGIRGEQSKLLTELTEVIELGDE